MCKELKININLEILHKFNNRFQNYNSIKFDINNYNNFQDNEIFLLNNIDFLINENMNFDALKESIIFLEVYLRRIFGKKIVKLKNTDSIHIAKEIIEKLELDSKIINDYDIYLRETNNDFYLNGLLLNDLINEALSYKNYTKIKDFIDFIKILLLSCDNKGANLRNLLFHGLLNEKTLSDIYNKKYNENLNYYILTIYILKSIKLMENHNE